MLIAGDIGGTKTLLALYAAESGARRPVAEAQFPSGRYRGLGDMIREFLAQTGARIERACFDVAGPVIGGCARLTNLPWTIEEDALCAELGLKSVTLLNDLKAIAHAVPQLQPDEVRVINAGRAEPGGAIAVVAPGTGLGEAFLVPSGADYLACPSEGGHADFAPADELQADLWRYARKRYGHVAFERVCSGIGIPNIYDFLRDSGRIAETPELAARFAGYSDRTPLIVDAALADPAGNPLAVTTLQTFVSILGAEAGNLALKVLATAGVYLGGGIPPRIIESLRDGRFMAAFSAKGRFADMMRAIPVRVIDTRAALLGAALFGLQQLRSD